MDIQDVKDIWDRVKDELEVNLPEHIFRTWVTPLEAVDYENNTLVLLSPHQMAVDILKKILQIKLKMLFVVFWVKVQLFLLHMILILQISI